MLRTGVALYINFVLQIIYFVKIDANGFVEEVSCSAESMTVVLNKTDPTLSKWLGDPESDPVIYIQGSKGKADCERSIKSSFGNQNIISLNFTVAYGQMCHVHLTDLGPNFQSSETNVVLENLVQNVAPPKSVANHIFCLYSKKIETINLNEISNNNEVIASIGGKPKPKVQMVFRDSTGKPLKSAKFGDPVGLYLMLSRDNTYKAINPKHCMFSDRREVQEPDARTLTFVQSNCPVEELSEIIQPTMDINEEIYYTQFQAFRFGHAKTVYAHCTVEVCLQTDECYKKCFNKVQNSNLTTDDILLRFKRNTIRGNFSAPDEIVAISSALTVFDEPHEKIFDIPSVSTNYTKFHFIYLSVICILSSMVILLSILTIHLHRKRNLAKKLIKMHQFYYNSRIFYPTPNTTTHFAPIAHQNCNTTCGSSPFVAGSLMQTTARRSWNNVQEWVAEANSAAITSSS